MGVSRDPTRRILIVDDEKQVRALLARLLATRGFVTAGAGCGEEALDMLGRERFDLVLSDVNMPGMDGMSLLAEIRHRHPETAILMLTACENLSMAVDAMKLGALDYIVKPFDLDNVVTAVKLALARRDEQRAQASRVVRLEETVRNQTQQLRTLLSDLNEASAGTLDALVAALDARERETTAHSRRVAEYSLHLAKAVGVQDKDLDAMRRGSMLHDIGKIGISDNILLKPGRLNEEEWSQMRRHPEIGYWILNGIEDLRPASQIVLAHHERFDGGGYPYGLRADQIPLGARIFSIADSLDAITSDRPYQTGKPFEAAREEIEFHSGAQFDPSLVACFLQIPSRVWLAIRDRTLAESPRSAADLPGMVLD